MEVYNKNTLELLQYFVPEVEAKLADIKKQLYGTPKSEIDTVTSVILNYIKKNNKKIYGGYSLDKLLKNNGKGDYLYHDKVESDSIPDIDMYTTDPVKDIVAISDELYKLGLKRISGREGMHKDTFKLFVNGEQYLDLSYVPKFILDNMKSVEINGFNYIDVKFTMIDYYRMICDPIHSNWRLEKTITRLYLMHKNFPFEENNKSIDIQPSNDEHINVVNFVYDFLVNNNSVIVYGLYAYNYYLAYIKSIVDVNLHRTNISFLEFISTDYINNVSELINNLYSKFNKSDFKVVEYHPCFQYLEYGCAVFYKDNLLFKCHGHNNICIPYIKVDPYPIVNNKLKRSEISKKTINIGSFNFNILMCMIANFVCRLKNQPIHACTYQMMVHLFSMRSKYLKKTNKTIFDDGLFCEFIIECFGVSLSPQEIKNLAVEQRKKEGKRLVFKYEPTGASVNITGHYDNISGNEIKSPQHLKLKIY